LRFYRILLAALIVTFCVGVEQVLCEEVKVNQSPNMAGREPLLVLTERGDPLILHYGPEKEGTLYIMDGKGKELGRIKKEGMEGSFIWMDYVDGGYVLLWRPKDSRTGDKFIYIHRAEGGKFSFDTGRAINHSRDVLLPIEVVVDGKKIFVIWADERASGYSIYMNRSEDGGRTFMNEDVNMTPGYLGNLFKLVRMPTGEYYFLFHGRQTGEQSGGIFYRTSADGETWSGIKKIQDVEDWAPSKIDSVQTPQGLVVFWGGAKGLWYADQETDGTWKVKFIEQSRTMDVNRFKALRDKEGKLYVVASYGRSLTDDRSAKPNVYVMTSKDNGRTWSMPVKVNHYPYDNISASFPDGYITEDGILAVVWQDHRLIRGNIYLNYSIDGGDTWMAEDMSLADSPGKYNEFYPYITGDRNKLYILKPRYKDDSMKSDEVNLYLREVLLNEKK
jgi:BNR repeat-like domain